MFDNNVWKAWNALKANGKPIVDGAMCDGDQPVTDPPVTDPPVTDPPVTDPPVTEPPKWGDWDEWNACSAGCGEGLKSRSRKCISGVCDGSTTESMSCTGPDGAVCPEGCKLNVGDFEQGQGKACSEMFRGPDGFYLPKSGRCGNLKCGDGADDEEKTWVCVCSKKGGCGIKVDGKGIADTEFGVDFDSFTACKGNLGGRIDGVKRYRWADGRRSAAQPESEVSGGDDWELMNVCYNRYVYDFPAMKTFAAEGDTDLPFESREEWTASLTYGTVVEREDGVLVCRYSSGKYNWSEDHEIYLQLSVKSGQMQWLSSELWWPYYDSYADAQPHGLFNGYQLVTQAADTMSYKYIEMSNWPDKLGGDPSYRFLCRMEHNGKWYNGAATAEEFNWGVPWSASTSSWSSSSVRSQFPHCTAITEDGIVLTAKANNKFYDSEERRGGPKTQYLVALADDGSHWGEWGEFGACPGWCGQNLKREKKRACFNGDGDQIEAKQSNNCLPDTEVTYPENSWDDIIINKITWDTIKDKCIDNDVLSKHCPNWSSWSEFGECSVTCGSGAEQRTRECICANGWDEGNKHVCAEMDHPLAAEGLCGDVSQRFDTRQCLKGSCGGEGLAEGDGEGLGCKSDSLFSNPHKMVYNSMSGFTCYNTAGAYAEVQWQTYENEYGFVPHNYACWYDNETCGSRFNMPSQQIIKNKPAICSCNEGACEWSQVERQDCTRGYEWIKMPINDMASHPLVDKIVDFENPSSPEPAQTAITGGWDGVVVHTHPNRRIAAPVAVTGNTLVHTDGHHTTWVLTHECEEGGLEWIEGPFDCSPYELPYSEAKDQSWYCLGEPRLYPMTDGKGVYTEYSSLFKNFPARIFGICRFKDENDAWIVGDLIKHEVFRGNSSRKTKFQCCPAGGSLVGEVTGCQDDNLWRPNGDYDSRPYQILYSGKCKTKGMAGWSAWSEWGACSKTCENGAVTGTRSKTRTCENGEVGEFGCNDSTIVEISEPCGMNLQCQRSGCTLDMNFVDFHRFRLSHEDGIKTSDYWQVEGVYTNRKEDLFADPRDWSGFFPEGSMVASYRCFNPNDNKLSGEEHDATCVCNDGVCDWDREMPVCSQHNTNHAGYLWSMPAQPEEGSFCVAANFGGVGVVTSGSCYISMATLPTEDEKGLQYFKTTAQFVSIDGVANSVIQELFDSTYPSFNEYYGDRARNEIDFYALSSPCGQSAFKWVSADQFSAATSVHLPTTFAWLHMNWSARFQHESAHLCRVTYANGKKCFGRFVNGTCGDVDATYATVDVLALDTDNCASSFGPWSECSGDTGVQCGPGTQTRGEDTRSCRGTCMMEELFNYGFHDAPNPNPRYQCNMPSYPTECHLCMNKRTYHKNKNQGSITMARYPLSSASIDFDQIKMTCSGGGYWDIDYLTGDRYYAPAANEECEFSCTDPLYDINGYGSGSYEVTKVVCSDRGFLDDNFQFTPPDEQPLFCDPNFCVFPSFGHWPVTDNKQQGSVVSMGVECEGQIDNGDHVMVAQGAKCNVVCVAENGKAYRADSTVSQFWCEDPIHREKLDDFGCKGGKCLSDWLAAPWDLPDWSWSDTWAFYGQSRDYDKGTTSLDDMNEHKKLQKCYKVADSTCDAEPPINSDESDIAEKVSWSCDNANQAGSSCTKVCASGTRPGGQKQTKTCDCTGSCQWKGQVTSCVPALCQMPDEAYWPSGIVCKTPDGVIQNGPDYPEGTDCAEPCEGEGYKYELWQSDWSTCVCDHESGKCAFDARKVNSCIIAACSLGLEWVLGEFEEGFDYDGAAIEHFSDDVECDSRWPDDHPDQAMAGMVPEGTNCYIKCKAGHEFKDEEVTAENTWTSGFVERNGTMMYSITCRDTHYHGLEWDVFDSAWDKYGDCGFISNYGYQCDTYPQCAPV